MVGCKSNSKSLISERINNTLKATAKVTAIGCESGYCTVQFSFPCHRTVAPEEKKIIKNSEEKTKMRKKIHRKKRAKQGRKKTGKKLPLIASVQMGYY